MDGLESLANGRIVANIEYLAVMRLDHQAGAIDKGIPQGLYRPKRPDRSTLPVHESPLGGADLQGPHEIEHDDAEHLPSAIGLIALRWHVVVPSG